MGWSTSIGTVHGILDAPARRAGDINDGVDLSAVRVERWGHDVLSLASPQAAVRQEMFDFVAAGLHQRERAGGLRSPVSPRKDDF